MKIFRIISWLILAWGILFKFIHYPGANFLTLLGGLLLLIYSLIFAIKNLSNNLIDSFLKISISLVMLYLVFRINYWSIAKQFFYLPFIFGLITLGLIVYNKTILRFKHILFGLYFFLFIGISFVHSYQIYYVFNYKELDTTDISNIEHPCFSYKIFNKYSWFLYLAGKHNKSLEYNKLSEETAEQCAQKSRFARDEVQKDIFIIRHNALLIKERKWEKFEEL